MFMSYLLKEIVSSLRRSTQSYIYYLENTNCLEKAIIWSGPALLPHSTEGILLFFYWESQSCSKKMNSGDKDTA